MERRSLESAALIAIAFLANACAPGKIGAGCSPSSTPNDSSRAATSPNHADRRRPGHEPSEVDEHTDKKSTQSEVDVRGPAEDAYVAPPGGGGQAVRPTAANTGPSNPGILTPYTGPSTITEDGATYENFARTGGITIDADNVTLRNFTLTTSGSFGIDVVNGHSGILIEDGEITNTAVAGIRGPGYTARRLHIHETQDDAIKPHGTGPTVIEYCFIEKVGSASGKGDPIQVDAGADTSNLTIRYNNIDVPQPGTPRFPGGPWEANSCFHSKSTFGGDLSNVVIEYNWLNGGHFSIYCEVPGISVRYNRFGRENDYGIVKGQTGRACDEWIGNVWDDTGLRAP